MSKVLFISHRHADERIATVLNEQLQSWQLERGEIFQSSDAQGGAHIGGVLSHELLGALSEARLVLLVYTVADSDWSYCMWECGAAMQSTTTPTKVIVLRMTDESPAVLRDLVSIRASVDVDIKRFVYQFFREKDWVREGQAFNSKISDAVLDDYAKKLHAALLQVTPKLKAHVKRRWDVFSLKFDSLTVQKIIASHEGGKEISEDTVKLIQNRGRVAYDFGQALLHFGYEANVPNLTLSHLVQRWRDEQGANPQNDRSLDWGEELCAEVLRALRDVPAKPCWALVHSHMFPGWWLYPVVANERIDADGSVELDVHMYRVPGDLPARVGQ
jgi:hypothetical protein